MVSENEKVSFRHDLNIRMGGRRGACASAPVSAENQFAHEKWMLRSCEKLLLQKKLSPTILTA